MRLLFLALFGLGCGAQPKPAAGSQPTEPAPPPAASSASGAVPVASAAEPSKIVLTVLEPPSSPSAVPRFEVLQPSFGDALDPRLALKHPVRVRADANWLSAEAEGIVVSLDGGRPRRILADSAFTLGDLLGEGQRLTEGPHALLAVAVAADGRALRVPETNPVQPLTIVGFFVGARAGDPPGPSVPQLFCLSPAGTHYLKPDGAVVLDVLAVGFRPERAALRVRGPGAELSTSFEPNRSYSIRGLPVGDVRLSVGSSPGPRAECVVTVNPELAERSR